MENDKNLNFDNLSAEKKEKIKNIIISDAFDKLIDFGTAGLRGIMEPGQNRINRHTIAHVSQAIANYMKDNNKKRIVIAGDTRNNSDLFEETAADVFKYNGIEVFEFDRLVPISVLSYTTIALCCDFGIYITASHNPAIYNGYKVFDSNGCQILESMAAEINKYREQLNISSQIKETNIPSKIVPNYIIDKFIQTINSYRYNYKNDIKVTYSGLFGTGNNFIDKILKANGFDVSIVETQYFYNGDFPGLKTPNPENIHVYREAIKVAEKNGSDIIITTDPDADRMGVMVKLGNGYVRLSGDQVGVLLLNYILQNNKNPDAKVVFSNVSTNLAKEICKNYNIKPIIVPTGFKYIGEKVDGNFVFGFEESCGYLIGNYIKDKDAAGAAVLFCEMTAYYKSLGFSLIDVLNFIYETFGYYKEYSFSIDTSINKISISDISNNVTGYKFKYLNEKKNMLTLIYMDDTEIIFRPSGTESSLKVYIKVNNKSSEEMALYFLNKYLKVARDICVNV